MKIGTYIDGALEKYIKQSKVDKTKQANIRENKTENTQQVSKSDVDKVEISPQAKLLSELLGNEDTKAEKLARVKAQIENGTYKPPISEIAKSILKEWKGE